MANHSFRIVHTEDVLSVLAEVAPTGSQFPSNSRDVQTGTQNPEFDAASRKRTADQTRYETERAGYVRKLEVAQEKLDKAREERDRIHHQFTQFNRKYKNQRRALYSSGSYDSPELG